MAVFNIAGALANKANEPERAYARLLVYDRIDPTDASLDWLEERSVEVIRGPALWESPPHRYSEDEIIDAASTCTAVMGASGARFTRQVIQSLPNLKFISKFGIGVETIDVDAASERGILVSNTPDDLSIKAVAEHTVGFILGLKKNFLYWTPQYLRSGGWRPGHFSEVLIDCTIGLVGLGRIAREVVKRLAGWEVRILAHDPFVTDPPAGVIMTDLSRLLAESDVISLHASSTIGNPPLLDAAGLVQMKRSAILINVGRSRLVDTGALRDALNEGRIAGAGIDVFDIEPPDPRDPLFECPNTMFSPHAAAWTRVGLERTGWQGARNLWDMMRGERNSLVINSPTVTRPHE